MKLHSNNISIIRLLQTCWNQNDGIESWRESLKETVRWEDDQSGAKLLNEEIVFELKMEKKKKFKLKLSVAFRRGRAVKYVNECQSNKWSLWSRLNRCAKNVRNNAKNELKTGLFLLMSKEIKSDGVQLGSQSKKNNSRTTSPMLIQHTSFVHVQMNEIATTQSPLDDNQLLKQESKLEELMKQKWWTISCPIRWQMLPAASAVRNKKKSRPTKEIMRNHNGQGLELMNQVCFDLRLVQENQIKKWKISEKGEKCKRNIQYRK